MRRIDLELQRVQRERRSRLVGGLKRRSRMAGSAEFCIVSESSTYRAAASFRSSTPAHRDSVRRLLGPGKLRDEYIVHQLGRAAACRRVREPARPPELIAWCRGCGVDPVHVFARLLDRAR